MQSKWLDLSQYQKIVRFLGRAVVKIYVVGIIVGLVLFLVEVAFAFGLQAFLNAVGLARDSGAGLPRLVPVSNLESVFLFLFSIGFIRAFLQWFQLYLQGAAAEELRFIQRGRLFKWAFNSESVSSSQVTLLMNERMAAAGSVVQNLQTLVIQLTSGILLGVSLFLTASKVTVLVFMILAFLVFPMRIFDKKISSSAQGLTEEGAKINRRLLMSIKNLLLMRIYGTQHIEEAKAVAGSEAIRRHHLVYYGYGALKFALPQVVGVAIICAIAILGTSSFGMPSGTLVSYIYIFVRFLQTFSSVSLSTATVIQYWPQAMELAMWWADHSFDGIRNIQKIDVAPVRDLEIITPVGWSLKNVSFRYQKAETEIFQDLNLSIVPGQCLVVTGPSGGGKSTLFGLLLGSLQPDSGIIEVSFNGQLRGALESFRSSLLTKIGYVGAESFLIEGSVYQNIVYGLQHQPSESAIKDAFLKAECQFVFNLPGGLDYLLTEQGQGLSAGQKQRLSLARALLRQPKILILDEATANLDLKTEAKLVDTLGLFKGQMTIIAATHREGLLKIADQHLSLGGEVE